MNKTSGDIDGPKPKADDASALKPGSSATPQRPQGKVLAVLALGALGVVYGDIGTSPLYAVRECFDGTHGIAVNRPNVLGVLSLIFWALMLIVSVKYIAFILRGDNKGEGGVLALPDRSPACPGRSPRSGWVG
jgi:KUP system potassium uptake protein